MQELMRIQSVIYKNNKELIKNRYNNNLTLLKK